MEALCSHPRRKLFVLSLLAAFMLAKLRRKNSATKQTLATTFGRCASQKAELARIVETGPDLAVDGVVRWRRIDLQKLIKERYVGTLLRQLGFSHVSARPRHPGQDGEIVEAYKKTSRAR